MTPRNQEAFNTDGQHGAVGRVIIAPARHRVVEIDALDHILLGHHILAFQHAGLAHAQLRGDIDDEAVLESGHGRARIIDEGRDPLPPFEIGARQARPIAIR